MTAIASFAAAAGLWNNFYVLAGTPFVAGYAMAFNGLAIVIVAMLLIGVFGAWELLVWNALARARAK